MKIICLSRYIFLPLTNTEIIFSNIALADDMVTQITYTYDKN